VRDLFLSHWLPLSDPYGTRRVPYAAAEMQRGSGKLSDERDKKKVTARDQKTVIGTHFSNKNDSDRVEGDVKTLSDTIFLTLGHTQLRWTVPVGVSVGQESCVRVSIDVNLLTITSFSTLWFSFLVKEMRKKIRNSL